MEKFDAVVVGGGVGGLSAAAHLAVAGRQVLLLEQYSVVGGCGHVFRRPGGFQFEVGIHYLGDCGPNGTIPRLLAGLGLEGHVEFLRFDRSGFDTIVHPGGRLPVPNSWDDYEHNLVAAFPGDAAGIARYLGVIRRLAAAVDRSAMTSDVRMLVRLARTGRAARWALRPFQDLLDHCRLSPEARAVVSTQWLSYACPPSRAPVLLHVGFLETYLGRGAYYPRGGGQVLAAALVRAIEANGGSVRTSSPVTRIVVEGGRVTGVELGDGSRVSAPVVVSNADLLRTYEDLVGRDHLPPRLARRLDATRMAVPWFNTYLGVDVDLRGWMPATNYFSMPSYADPAAISAELIEHGHRTDLDAWLEAAAARLPSFVHSASRLDPTSTCHAPPGWGVIESMTNVPADPGLWGTGGRPPAEGYRRNERYAEVKTRLEELMIDRVEAALPGIRPHIVFRESSTPHTHARYTRSTDGNAYGAEMSTAQARTRARSDGGIDGLFLAGTSTAFGPAIEGVMVSGAVTAGAIAGQDLFGRALSGAPPRVRVAPPAPGEDPLEACRRPPGARGPAPLAA